MNNTEPGGEPVLSKGKRSCFLLETRHVARCQSRY